MRGLLQLLTGLVMIAIKVTFVNAEPPCSPQPVRGRLKGPIRTRWAGKPRDLLTNLISKWIECVCSFYCSTHLKQLRTTTSGKRRPQQRTLDRGPIKGECRAVAEVYTQVFSSFYCKWIISDLHSWWPIISFGTGPEKSTWLDSLPFSS